MDIEDLGNLVARRRARVGARGALDALRGLRWRERVACIPLHGELEPQEQDRAFAPNPLRKVIVATNVAETSITIDGIRHVVDSGVARVARYDAERGIGTLLLEPISRASADQRKGRAGRTAPGTCHRLWTVIGHKSREERNTPEIQRSDLAEVVLLLHSLGIREAAAFDWLDKPDPQAVERAERLLTMLGALLDADLVIGGVLIPGAAAPKLVTADMVSRMKQGAVVVDVAIDQGGCFETSHPTTHTEPTFVVDGVVHYCVANMPGAVARTSTFALNHATIGHAIELADKGWKQALKDSVHLRNGLNVALGQVTYAAVAQDLGYPYVEAETLLG